MKKTRIISMLLVLALMLSMLPMTVLAAEEEFKVTVSIEGLTLGQGFYAEPRVYTLDEINARLERNCTGNKDVTAAMVTQLLIEDAGMEWKHSGKIDDGTFYLSSIKVGEECMSRPVKLPQTTVDQYGSDLDPIKDTEWLGEFCYNNASGWMITVDNALTPVGAGSFTVENGDVIRWRFSVFGWGADIGCGSSWGGTPSFAAADMDSLFAEYARQVKAGTLTAEGRENALAVMTHIDASQAETDAALVALKAAEAKAPEGMAAVLNVASSDILNQEGQEFNLTVSLTGWDAEAGYKLMDCVMPIPDGVTVESVTPGDRIGGGEMRYSMDEESGLLRIAYADLTQNTVLTVSGDSFPVSFFTLRLRLDREMDKNQLNFNMDRMTLKVNAVSDESSEDYAMVLVDVSNAAASVNLLDPPAGPDFTVLAEELYRGDGTDLIPADKKVVMVRIPEWADPGRVARLVYQGESPNIDFYFNLELTSEVYLMPTYAAVVAADMELDSFKNPANYQVIDGLYEDYYFAFGKVFWDHSINAQDALAILNAWLRVDEEPLSDRNILSMNNNIDGSIDTFDVLGVVAYYVDGTPFEAFNKLQAGTAQ